MSIVFDRLYRVHGRDVGDGWAGRTIAQPGFGRSVNPRGQIVPPHYSVASYVPEFNSKSKSAHSKKSFLINSIVDSQQSNMHAQSFNKHVHAREKKEVISVQKTFLSCVLVSYFVTSILCIKPSFLARPEKRAKIVK